ncbi:hypothetical protein ACFO0N_14210 [Halobium salinum]|uniref:CBM-cenC domain-containing protein n=1 Tax=Halobium salinum TaxID=1364940 RepID=A0ABD5PEH4_9EURY|nr:hypothetical protein [Halobium salinum]
MSLHPFPSRRAVLGAAAAVGVASLAGCLAFVDRPGSDPEPVTLREGFEDGDGLGEWTAHGHVGSDAGGPFRFDLGGSTDRAVEGSRSLRVFTGGEHDDGTAWVSHPVRVVAGHAYDATFSVRAWSEGESFNTVRHVVAVLSPTAPTVEGDFPEPDWNSSDRADAPVGGLREPMDGSGEGDDPEGPGWRTYRFTWRTPELTADTLHLAVGVSVVWETDRVDYLDDVRLDLTPVG